MANYTKEDYKKAVANIKVRMENNAVMHYCNDLENARNLFGKQNKNRKATLQLKTYLSTFLQSNLYERFLLLESFCVKGTYLSDEQDKTVSNIQSVVIGGKYYLSDIYERLVGKLTDQIRDVLDKFFEMSNGEEIAEIKALLENDINARESSACRSAKYFAVTTKLKALLKAVEEKVAQNQGNEELA